MTIDHVVETIPFYLCYANKNTQKICNTTSNIKLV